MVLNM
jgi:hypothetical protein